MDSIRDVLMKRDGNTLYQANRRVEIARQEAQEIIANGGTIEDIEDLLAYDFGLELDYIFDLL